MALQPLTPSMATSAGERALEMIKELDRRLTAVEQMRGVNVQVLTFSQLAPIQNFTYNGGRLWGVKAGQIWYTTGGLTVVPSPHGFNIGSYTFYSWLATNPQFDNPTVANKQHPIPGAAGEYLGTALTPGIVAVTSTPYGSGSEFTASLMLIEHPRA